MSKEAARKSDTGIYLLASILGICAGILDVRLGDLLISAIFVMLSNMSLGLLRPRKPWRWVLVVGVFVPIMQLLAYVFLTQKPYPSHIYESFLGFLTGIAGAYAGAFGRMAINELFFPQPAPEPERESKVSAS
jgi:hypothetical protein